MLHLFYSLSTSIQIGACFFGSIIVVASIVIGIDAFMTWYHTYRMSIPDEFENNYDPYADSAPHWNSIDRVRTLLFQDVATMHAWLVANIDNESRKVHLYVQAVIEQERTGMFRFTVELSNEERLRVL